MKFIIIGFGYWGKNFLKFFQSDETIELVAIVENRETRIGFRHFYNLDELLSSGIEFDAAIIATPTSTHYHLVVKLLELGKHVFCEKPLTNSYETTTKLIELAKINKKILHTNYLYLYNKAISKIFDLIKSNEIGRIKLISFERTGLGPIRSDVNALYDLASHDISILNMFISDSIKEIIASGKKDINSNYEGAVNSSLLFSSGVYVNIFASWLHPEKTRVIKIVGEKKMIVYNDLSMTEKLKLYDKTVESFEIKNSERNSSITNLSAGDILIPDIIIPEPLRESFYDFINKIKIDNFISPINNLEVTIKTSYLLEEVNKKIVSI